METALLAIAATTILGLALGAIIGAAAKFFAVSSRGRAIILSFVWIIEAASSGESS